jgi:integrase
VEGKEYLIALIRPPAKSQAISATPTPYYKSKILTRSSIISMALGRWIKHIVLVVLFMRFKILDQEFCRIAKKYGIKGNFSTHSLRKTFGRHVWEMDNNSERSLIMLSKIFNHTHSDVTRIYLGITAQEISDIYINL